MTATPRVLVSLLSGDRRDIDLARRRIGYDRLVLVAHPGVEGLAADVSTVENAAARDPVCTIVHVGPDEVVGLLASLRRLLDGLGRAQVVLNAAGGSSPLLHAAILLAFERGIETWFFQAGHAERLPVLHGVRLEDRLDQDERRLLRALPLGGETSTVLAEQQVLPRAAIERTLRRLRDKGLVATEAREARVFARPTAEGKYLRDHLVGP